EAAVAVAIDDGLGPAAVEIDHRDVAAGTADGAVTRLVLLCGLGEAVETRGDDGRIAQGAVRRDILDGLDLAAVGQGDVRLGLVDMAVAVRIPRDRHDHSVGAGRGDDAGPQRAVVVAIGHGLRRAAVGILERDHRLVLVKRRTARLPRLRRHGTAVRAGRDD